MKSLKILITALAFTILFTLEAAAQSEAEQSAVFTASSPSQTEASQTAVFRAGSPARKEEKQKLSGIKKIEETALLNNLDYKSAVLDVLKAYNDLEKRIKLDDSSVSLSGTYTKQSSSGETGYATAVTLPVFEKLSLNASVDNDFTRTFGFNITPLENSGSVELTNLTYRTKLACAEETADNIAENAAESYLEWISASRNHKILKQTAEVKRILYSDEKIRFEKGESVLDDVREAFTQWSDSRTDLNNAWADLQTAEEELYSVLNVDSEEYLIEYPADDELPALIRNLKEKIKKEKLTTACSYNILEAENNAESIETELSNTSVFEPKLDIGTSYTISEDEDPELSVTVLLTMGFESWKSSDIEELEKELDISRQQVLRVKAEENYSLKQALSDEETAEINYKTAAVELEQAKELYDEASYLNRLGEYSETELEETHLLYRQAEIDLFTAEADHYSALLDLEDFTE